MTPMNEVAVASHAMSPVAARIRAVLTHPVSMWVKQHMRSAVWLVRGVGVQNPPLPARIERVLFVCLGNVCRSPFAALLAERLQTEAARTDITCTSAGIRPSQAGGPPAAAREVSARYGLSLDRHVPRPLTRDMVTANEMVIVMEAEQLHQMRAEFPELRDRFFLLSLYDERACGAYERCNIGDPFGQPVEAFEVCYMRIARALDTWMAALSAARGTQ